MHIHIEQTATGRYVVSEGGSWLPGVYASEAAARRAVDMDPEQLDALWQSALAASPDAVLALADLEDV